MQKISPAENLVTKPFTVSVVPPAAPKGETFAGVVLGAMDRVDGARPDRTPPPKQGSRNQRRRAKTILKSPKKRAKGIVNGTVVLKDG